MCLCFRHFPPLLSSLILPLLTTPFNLESVNKEIESIFMDEERVDYELDEGNSVDASNEILALDFKRDLGLSPPTNLNLGNDNEDGDVMVLEPGDELPEGYEFVRDGENEWYDESAFGAEADHEAIGGAVAIAVGGTSAIQGNGNQSANIYDIGDHQVLGNLDDAMDRDETGKRKLDLPSHFDEFTAHIKRPKTTSSTFSPQSPRKLIQSPRHLPTPKTSAITQLASPPLQKIQVYESDTASFSSIRYVPHFSYFSLRLTLLCLLRPTVLPKGTHVNPNFRPKGFTNALCPREGRDGYQLIQGVCLTLFCSRPVLSLMTDPVAFAEFSRRG